MFKNKKYIRVLILGILLIQPAFISAATLNKNTYQPEETAIVFTGPIGGSSVIVYNIAVSYYITASGIGDDPMEIQLTSDIFAPGDYIIVNTKEPNGCQLFTLDECRANSDYLGETAFSIGASQPSATQSSSLLGGLGELLGF